MFSRRPKLPPGCPPNPGLDRTSTAARLGRKHRLPTFCAGVYFGGLIRPKIVGDHFQHPTVIDIAGLKVVRSGFRTPVLHAHDRKDLIGRTTRVDLLPDRITAEGILSVPGPARDRIVSAARSGFRWGVSMGVEPDEVFFLPATMKTTVNQQEVWGPVHIVLSGTLMDISLLPTGADKLAYAEVIRVNGRFDLRSRLADCGRALLRAVVPVGAQVEEAQRW